MNSELSCVPVKEKIGFGLGDVAFNFYFQMYLVYMLYFYTDVFGITAAVVGTMFLVSRMWDAVASEPHPNPPRKTRCTSCGHLLPRCGTSSRAPPRRVFFNGCTLHP